MNFDVISPNTKDELLIAMATLQNSNYKIGAGYTDLINDLKSKSTDDLTIINIAQLNEPEFVSISKSRDFLELGALVTASDIVNHPQIKNDYPVLYESAESVASVQIRNLATIGGNICNASPSADMSAALVALNAVCQIMDTAGNVRSERLEDMITGVRSTSLQRNEILYSVWIPKNIATKLRSGFEKIGTRNSMEISIVSLAYHFQLNDDGKVLQAGVSCGAVAPVIPFARAACDYLLGKNISTLSEFERTEFANKVMEYASPISDIRASDWYRKEVLFNLSKSIFE
jgi:CO/xanthine dehydrogenase FAD-binding subunit